MHEGALTWMAWRKEEKLTWVIDAAAEELVFDWKTQVDEHGCDNCHPCTCMSFQAFEVGCEGHLLPVLR